MERLQEWKDENLPVVFKILIFFIVSTAFSMLLTWVIVPADLQVNIHWSSAILSSILGQFSVLTGLALLKQFKKRIKAEKDKA